MLLFRPCQTSDLMAIERIAAASPVGVTSLPVDRNKLAEKIEASLNSMAAEVSYCGEESYFFVLEDQASGDIVGVSGIVAAAGFREPFYNYRNETLIHANRELGVHTRIHALSLCHDLSGNTLLTSFYIREPLRFTAYSDLLSRARFLFMASHRQRFADGVVSEMVGVTDADGNTPFWDSVGRTFFGIDYPTAEHYCGTLSRTFIAELLPQHPLYVPLLSDAAQAAIGQLHSHSELPFDILQREGFEAENYIDPFDGGPILHARMDNIRTLRENRLLTVREGQRKSGEPHLLANCQLGEFRATVAELSLPHGREITLDGKLMAALALQEGDSIRVAAL